MNDPKEFPTSITFTPTAAALTFYGGDTRVWLTISPDGIMAVGPGLSEDEATQRVAAMLASRYSALHREQADALAAKDAALSEMRAELDAALKLADWSAIQNNTVVNEVWGILGGPDATREGGQSLVVRVKEMRAELDARLDDLGRVIMACPMSPETRTSPAHIGVRVLRDRLEAAEAQLDLARKALAEFSEWCQQRASSIGAVDGYDYRSGEEAAYRHASIEAGKRARALASQDEGEER